MSVIDEIMEKQHRWAANFGLTVEGNGYLESYEKNLFQPLNQQSRQAFDNGSGSELKDHHTGRPAKMRALHSSSALAVNFFDPWVDKEASSLMQIFELDSCPLAIRFEEQYPTGLRGNPPNLDIVLELPRDFIIGIESKFTEWVARKTSSTAPFKESYFPSGVGVWDRVGLPESQRLAGQIQSKKVVFYHLDAPQLLKHALGLATHYGQNFRLLYVYYDAHSSEAETHREEIGFFADRLNNELGFQAFSYQELIARLEDCSGFPDQYLEYLLSRYA